MLRMGGNMSKNIVFDMDGVILDSERLILTIWEYIGHEHGIPTLRDTMYKCIGVTKDKTREIMLETYGPDFPYEELRKEASQQFKDRTKKDGVPVKTGAREFIQYLKTNGWQIGLASSTLHETIQAELEFLGMYKFFDHIVSGEMVRESKPHPEIFFKACEMMGSKPEETYAVEDSKNGVRAAAMAGLKVILVPDVVLPDEDTERLCWKKFPDLSEVRRYFNTKDLEN